MHKIRTHDSRNTPELALARRCQCTNVLHFDLGYAMKADDPFKAFGAVIGKALRSLEAGRGMIPILIALQ